MRVGRWSIVMVWLVACGPAIPPLPSRGGPAWFELESEHVTLWTDAQAERGRELMREIERRHQLVATAMHHAGSKARSFVIALRNSREAAVYLPKNVVAVAWNPHNPTSQPGILLPADADDRQHVVNHELTHVISYGIIKHQPPWLAEGIATYFQMVDLDAGKSSVEIGIPPENVAGILVQSRPLSTAKLFACKELGCRDGLFYATSWALFSFLAFTHYGQLHRYLQRLSELPDDQQAEAWNAAWNAVFADLPLDKLDRDLSEWLVTGELGFPRVDVTVHDVPTRERPLGDADVLAAHSLLSFQFKDAAATIAATDAALAIDRTNLLARLIETEVTHTIAPDDARATAAAHPDDWRAWRLLAQALKGSPEANQAIGKACALAGSEGPACDRVRE